MKNPKKKITEEDYLFVQLRTSLLAEYDADWKVQANKYGQAYEYEYGLGGTMLVNLGLSFLSPRPNGKIWKAEKSKTPPDKR